MPATTSATMKPTISASPIPSRRASVSGPTTACEWPAWEWPCEWSRRGRARSSRPSVRPRAARLSPLAERWTATGGAGRTMRRVILDGHNDLVLRRWRGEAPQHIDLARAAEADFCGGFFALYVPSRRANARAAGRAVRVPLDDAIPREEARRVAEEHAAVLEGLGVPIARRVDDFEPGRVTAIMHLEGAEPLAPDLSDLEALVRPRPALARASSGRGRTRSPRACRSASRPRPTPAPGLTDAGPRPRRAPATGSGILVDVSHLNEAGFWDVARISIAPLVATHSNAHALCASTRNLTDEQLDAIGRSGGVVGVNFAIGFLRADGHTERGHAARARSCATSTTSPSGSASTRVAFGSDFEGATVPAELGGDGRAAAPRRGAARARLRRRGAREDHARQLAARARPDVAALGPLLRPGRRRPAADAARRARPVRRAGPRRRPRRGHRPRHGRAAAPRLERDRDRRRARGDRPPASRSRAASRRSSRRASPASRTRRGRTCDLVNASYALPFTPARARSTRSGRGSSTRCGRAAASAASSSASTTSGRARASSSQPRAEVEAMLAPFEVERLRGVRRRRTRPRSARASTGTCSTSSRASADGRAGASKRSGRDRAIDC